MIVTMSFQNDTNLAKPTPLSLPKHPSQRARARFPIKLRIVLEDAINESNEHIISWLPNGKAFKVHKPEMFSKLLMKRYFRQSHFRSFTRQLYHYGFERCEAGAFYHPLFQRGDETLSWNMSRKMKNDESLNSAVGSGAAIRSSQPMFSPANNALNAPFVMSLAVPATRDNLPLAVKNMECLDDVRLQKPAIQNHDLIGAMPFRASACSNNNDNSLLNTSYFMLDEEMSSKEESIGGVKTTADLTELELEPRSIEQMQAQPLLDVMDHLAMWCPTTNKFNNSNTNYRDFAQSKS